MRIYIEPHVFIFSDRKSYLFYDSIGGEYLKLTKQGVESVVERILQNENYHYFTDMSLEEADCDSVKLMIEKLRACFMGDVLGVIETPPALFAPVAHFQKQKFHSLQTHHMYSTEVFKNLYQITIYTDGVLPNYIDGNTEIYLQTIYYRIFESTCSISIDVVRKLLQELSYSNIQQLNWIGRNLIKRKDIFDVLRDDFPIFQKRSILYFHIKEYSSLYHDFSDIEDFKIKILISCTDNEIDEIEIVLRDMISNVGQYEFCFLVCSEKQYLWAEQFEHLCTLSIIPVFDGSNRVFFEDYVFVDEEDILGTVHLMKEIHGKQFINYHYFGKIAVGPDGCVYDQNQLLGNINNQALATVIENMLLNDSSWTKIRNMSPCSDCIFQWLCPSPFGYEEVIGKTNLCSVKYEE